MRSPAELWEDARTFLDDESEYVSLGIRVLVAFIVIWYSSKATQSTRFFSGLCAAATIGFLAHTFLEPMFLEMGTELAVVALWILIINAAAVGMSLGVMLPTVLPGLCFGLLGTVMAGVFIDMYGTNYFAIVACIASVLCGIIGSRLEARAVVTYTTVLTAGCCAACLVMQSAAEICRSIIVGEAPTNAVDVFGGGNGVALVWLAASLLVITVIGYREKGFDCLKLSLANRHGYSRVPTTDNGASTKSASTQLPQHLISPPPTDVFNMFDPPNLPPRLGEYAHMVYSACEELGNFFGFQDSSVRNQAEHVLILLSNNRRYMNTRVLESEFQPPSPIHALHYKVFSNYGTWCKAMGVSPNFSRMSTSMAAPPAIACRVVDLVLYFCIWGEGSNLRHMSECTWFLYHKMMEEYMRSEGHTESRSLYAGHYLDHVVQPIYDIVQKNMKKTNKDHDERRNYDDFNEFFWSTQCLQYRYSTVDPSEADDIEYTGLTGPLPGEFQPPITEALEHSPKTFLEKRSWLRGVLALNRILEWHIVTFYLLSVAAFAKELVWGWSYTTQVASGVFWVFNLCHLCWALLEVWGSYPGIALNITEVGGSVLVISARFLGLVYQTLYVMWAFSPKTNTLLGVEADSTYWWWQYIWLSLIIMIPYAFEMLLQIFPRLSTSLYTSQNDIVQSFLNVLYPLSRLYVGKRVHESLRNSIVYTFFWVTLLAWKLFFSFIFEVYSMVLPSLKLTDDYVNYPNQSFAKMMLLLIMRWSPQFLVYLIDTSIWYAVWQAFAGTTVGFSDELGNVRSMDDIRQNFGRAPEAFCKKMLSPDAGSRRGSSTSLLGSSSHINMTQASALQGVNAQRLQSYVNRLLDVRIQKWVMFSAAWNEIIDHFREEDIVSHGECDNLKFSQFDGFSQAIYLPVFQTAGAMDDVLSELERLPIEGGTDETLFEPITQDVTMQTAVAETWELGSFLLKQVLGPMHSSDIDAIAIMAENWMANGNLSANINLRDVKKVMQHFIAAVQLLHKGIKKRKPAAKPRSLFKRAEAANRQTKAANGGIRKAVSATSLTSLDTDSKATDKKPNFLLGKREEKADEVIIDALRDQVRDKLRNMMHALKGLVQMTPNGSAQPDEENREARDVFDRITFLGSMENGFFWDDAYASDQLDDISEHPIFIAVLKKAHGLLCLHPDDVEPKNREVNRRLTFFVNSLFMDMPDAPSLHDMYSWNVLTPYYSEDVLYSEGDLEKRTDALGVSTLLYLKTLFKHDWNNFLERLGIQDEEVFTKAYANETRRWASNRAQTLSRTVNGMMYYEKALRLLANMERLDNDTTNDLLGEKFGYIVSCQVYGNMKRNQDTKAEDIDSLMHRFPHLRVAYIDTIRVNRGSNVYYSCLMKSDGLGNIQEIYRVRLPGNPVIGEGKPENQNHAMIFTRSECLQTIDMNQEGYFEEALKMRNCLQEFGRSGQFPKSLFRAKKQQGRLPTTILGLREHIFTGAVSSLANYMALQEISFTTLGQRVLNRPLHIRQHYGHPDVFDKIFFITRGGISKSSKGINLSEDIFAGYNNTNRGGSVDFKEFLQVGKGRDVGMSQIYKFEAKLSQGSAEQSLSRDVYRMCNRLDFFRLFSFYYGGIGHYFSNVLTILTVYVVVYLMAVLAVFDLEKIGGRPLTPSGTIQMLLGGLGLLQTIPLFATLGVERGWLASLQEIFMVFLTGGPLHFMFHIQTKAKYMAQTIHVGGTKYRATGRGFVTQHTPFDEQYRFFASSHLYLGIELAAGLILMGCTTRMGEMPSGSQYFGRTWSLWLASVSFLASPFWFNPLTFEWNVVSQDYATWWRWILGDSGGSSKSWSKWWDDENDFYKNVKFSTKALFMVKAVLYLVIAEGIRTNDKIFMVDTTLSKPPIDIRHLFTVLGLLILLSLYMHVRPNLEYPVRRTLGILIFIGSTSSIIILFLEDNNYVRYAFAAYYAIGGLSLIALASGINAIKYVYLVHDIVCAHVIFIPIFLLAILQLPGMIQNQLLYHNALSESVVVSDVLKYARKTKESSAAGDSNAELVEQIADLRRVVQRQEQLLTRAGLVPGDAAAGTAEEQQQLMNSTAAGGASGASEAKPSYGRSESVGARAVGRAISMSGIDVWGEMAFGETNQPAQSQPNAMEQETTEGSYQAPATSNSEGFSFSQPVAMPPR